ncbi:restriction endonuclease subunit S [Candidatus Nitrosotenuis sp. DW1]|uniref:restriction endonuclease subunit S n=1 Tax=Candidatus Nitrosotenuis sp. DW1 TaxID=2259672 RepID=UPI0015CD4073|nr:restriction endonuclease subunit S [Candidatus Nitrosotenuis sp. DW1]QLH09466.1 hypothetical protein DSQ19_08255 [Candidatus Nitrosotenuis sp. DW1]
MSELIAEVDRTDQPACWITAKLSDVSEIKSGGTPSTTKKEYWNGEIAWVNSGKLKDDLITEPSKFITKKGLENSAAKLFPKDTVVIALTGATTSKVGYLTFPSTTNQSVTGILPNDYFIPRYVFYALISEREQILKQKIGTAQHHINQKIVENILIPFPPLNEQKRIVAKIEELFSLIDLAVGVLTKTRFVIKQYKSSLLKSAFSGELTINFRKQNPNLNSNQLLDEINKNKKNQEKKLAKIPIPESKHGNHKIPSTWAWAYVGNICSILQYGTSEKANSDSSGIPVLRMGNILDGELIFEKLKYYPKNWDAKNDFLLEAGDVLFNRTNSAELVGKTAVFRDAFPDSVFASYLIRVKVFSQIILPTILSHYVNSPFGRMFIRSVVSQQVGQANVNGTKFSMMPIPLIPFDEQKILLDAIEMSFSVSNKISNELGEKLEYLNKLKQTILKQAFEGKLVPQDPNDEPAEILLQKIKQEKQKIISQSTKPRKKK